MFFLQFALHSREEEQTAPLLILLIVSLTIGGFFLCVSFLLIALHRNRKFITKKKHLNKVTFTRFTLFCSVCWG